MVGAATGAAAPRSPELTVLILLLEAGGVALLVGVPALFEEEESVRPAEPACVLVAPVVGVTCPASVPAGLTTGLLGLNFESGCVDFLVGFFLAVSFLLGAFSATSPFIPPEASPIRFGLRRECVGVLTGSETRWAVPSCAIAGTE